MKIKFQAIFTTEWFRFLCLIFCIIALAGCSVKQSIESIEAQQVAQTAWSQPWHGTWDLSWAEMPIPGSIIFMAWQTQNANQQRLEILEANVPALVGLVYLNDGQQAWHYNRLEPDSPLTAGDKLMPFSPLTDAFAQVTHLLAERPHTASQKSIQTPHGEGLELTLHYPQSRTLTLQLDSSTNLIIQAHLESPQTNFSLISRAVEPLIEIHPDLFKLPKAP